MSKVSKPAQRLYRHRDDTAYVEASRDALLRHLIKVGHSPAWIEVLMGCAPGIVLPTGEVDQHELELCRQAVIELHGKAAPETPYDDELDQYLTPDQRKTLGQGKPVIMMAFLERQLKLGVTRQNTDLQSRVRDAIAFGMAQSLQYIGRYMADPALAISKTVDGAVRDAAGLLCGSEIAPKSQSLVGLLLIAATTWCWSLGNLPDQFRSALSPEPPQIANVKRQA